MIPDAGEIIARNKGIKTLHIGSSSPGNPILSLLKYAAVVITTIGLTLCLYHYMSGHGGGSDICYHTVSAPLGQATDIILADGSKVTLNSGTVLTYPANYSKKNRCVALEGEAFFEVISDHDNPFTVTSLGIEIVARGTSFNVDAYSDDCDIDVTLVDGSVDIYSNVGKSLVRLNPGENAMVNIESMDIQVSRVDTKFFTSWKRGMITFSNRRLEDIAKDLERWYSVEILFLNDETKDIRYSGTILKHKPVDQVLEVLRLTSDFQFNIEVINNRLSRIIIKE